MEGQLLGVSPWARRFAGPFSLSNSGFFFRMIGINIC